MDEVDEVGEDNFHLLFHFNSTFSQLIAWELRDRHEHKCDYSAFLHLAEELVKTHRVHLHTLNHDLYMERLACSAGIRGEIDDGFGDLGSPYFKRIEKKIGGHKVRLSRFIDKFEKPFCLYKLHGSIDQHWVKPGRKADWIKLKEGMRHWPILKEVKENGRLLYMKPLPYVVPDFLTGTKSKVKWYKRTKVLSKDVQPF